MGSYKETFKTKKASGLKKYKRNMEMHNTGERPGRRDSSSQNQVCHYQQLPHSITNCLSKRCCGEPTSQRNGGVGHSAWGPTPGTSQGWSSVDPVQFTDCQKIAANQLINCFDPDLLWTTWTDPIWSHLPISAVSLCLNFQHLVNCVSWAPSWAM